MEKMHYDIHGPLPQYTEGNVYILVMVYQFTKWVECILISSYTTEVTAAKPVLGFIA